MANRKRKHAKKAVAKDISSEKDTSKDTPADVDTVEAMSKAASGTAPKTGNQENAKAGGKVKDKGKGKGKDKGAGGKDAKSNGKRHGLWEVDASTAELEAIVFGGPATSEVTKSETAKPPRQAAVKDNKLVETDATEEPAQNKAKSKKRKSSQMTQSNRPAWRDPDDAALQVNLTAKVALRKFQHGEKDTEINGNDYVSRLRAEFQRRHGSAGWAERGPQDAEEDSSDEEQELRVPTSKNPTKSVRDKYLPSGNLDVERQRELVIEEGVKKGFGKVEAIQFHPKSELMLMACQKRLRLFQIDGEDNSQVGSFFFPNFPVKEAVFTPDGRHVLMAGNSYKMQCLDVERGEAREVTHMCAQPNRRVFGLTVGPNQSDRPGSVASRLYSVLADSGTVHVCDLATRQPVRTLRMSMNGVAAAFSPEHDTLFTADEDCNIYEWDLSKGSCVQKSKDSFAVKITCLESCRSSGRAPSSLLAVGTTTGYVDLFDTSSRPLRTPVKSIGNLTTRIKLARFNSTGEILALASDEMRDAVKLVHTGTKHVFANWPTQTTPFGRVTALDFSRQEGFLAVGNETGRVLLFRLSHYRS